MDTICYAGSREIPMRHHADVIVLGGGPGGLGAAVMAARAGAQVLLIERYGYLGGMAASGEVTPFMGNHAHADCLDRPVYVEWANRMHRYLPPELQAKVVDPVNVGGVFDRIISKDIAMLAAEDLCLEAGVELLYHHQLADVIMEGRAISSVVLLSKSGFSAAQAAQFVDCTGDGDLAVKAGCTFEQGGAGGFCQPMTLCFKLSYVQRDRMPERAEINRLYSEAKARGDIDCPRENVLLFTYYDDDVVHFNTTRVVMKNGVDGVELSAAEIEGRRQVRQILDWLRRAVTGFEQARIHSIAHHIGVRETRRITGLRTITREDFVNAAKYPDGIARVCYSIDIHNPLGSGTEIVHMPPGDYYEIPYGCIVPRDVDNLTVGGRPISVDHAIHSSMRVMPPACSVGQAAGMAAAMSVAAGMHPADLDGREVRQRLIAQGAFLQPAVRC